MDFRDFLGIKSSEEIKREREEYDAKAFPFGEKEKEIVTNILKELFKDEYDDIALFNYLIARQEAFRHLDNTNRVITEDGIIQTYKTLKKTVRRKFEDHKKLYIALAEANLFIDENLNFPSIEQLTKRAEEIQEIINK